MKNSIRFLSRALVGTFVTLTLLSQSLLGQMTGFSITSPTEDTLLVTGQEFTIFAMLSWDALGADAGTVQLTRIYEGIPDVLVAAEPIDDTMASVSFPGLVIPELAGVSNELTYILTYTSGMGNAGRSTTLTVVVGEANPVDGELTSVSIDFPDENADVSVTEPIWIQASVLPLNYSRNVKMDFYADGFKINRDPVSSTNGYFNFSWEDHWVGNIRITARATLNNGTFIDSAPRRFRVHPVGSAPEITLEAVDGTNDVVGGVNKAFTVHVNDSGSLIETVVLYVNGVPIETKDRDNYPYKFVVQMPQYGIVEVWARAYFSNKNRARSEILRYVLNTGSAPTVELLSPMNGATFLPGTDVKIFATAYDSDSLISSIDFFVNDTYVNTVERVMEDEQERDGMMETVLGQNRNLFDFNYQLPFSGDYRIFAQATDESGRTTRSNVVVVTAGAPDRSVPVVALSRPLSSSGKAGENMMGVGSTYWLNAYAYDEDGWVRSVKFFANGQEIGETVTKYGEDFSYAFQARTTGTFYLYAQATDNHGKVSQSPSVRLDVVELSSPVPSIYLRPIDLVYQDLPAALDSVMFSGDVVVPSGEGKVLLFANGVLVGTQDVASGLFNASYVPMLVGDVSITAVVQDGVNFVRSNERILRVAPQSKNVDFLDLIITDFLCGYLYEEFLDDQNAGWGSGYYNELIHSLDNGQRTRAEFVHELMMASEGMRDTASDKMPAVNFSLVRNALMIRWALTGQWPTTPQMASDVEVLRRLGQEEEGSGERRLVRLCLPALQTRFFGGNRIPDSFSSDKDCEDFVKVLFDRKFGVAPNNAQLDRCVQILQMSGTEWFVRDFLLDNDSIRFGGDRISTLLGIPNLPNSRLVDYANSASLFIGLLRIVPDQSDVESRSNLPLIEQIQIILDAMPEI